jgi:phosphocarrier protein
MTERQVTVTNELGLHLRAAAKLVGLTARTRSSVRIAANGTVVDGKSLLGITSLMASTGTVLTVSASGEDEQTIVDAVVRLVESGFTDQP